MSNNDSYYNKILGESFELAVKNKKLENKEYKLTKENELLKARVKELEEQLKRKEQEYEELKAYAQRQENQREEYYKEFLKLSQECEALKSESFTREELIGIQEKDIGRYRKALEGIEEIASKDYYDDTWANISIKIDKILNIINKAKGE